MKGLLVFLLFVIILPVLTYIEAAEDMPVVNLPMDKSNLGSVALVVYKHFGAIEGYIVFRNKDGRMCSVRTQTWHGLLTIPYSGSEYLKYKRYEKEIKLNPDKFEWVRVNIWGYPLEPILIDREKIKEKYPTVYFELKLTDWRVSDKAY